MLKGVNYIIGHISHTPLLVPFNTWAESHRRHHIGHNHYKNDYSHPWVPHHKSHKKPQIAYFLQKTGLAPILGFMYYLLGIFSDGGHWVPIGGRLHSEQFSYFNLFNYIISSSSVGYFLYFIISTCSYHFYTFMEYYGVSWFVFCWWLYTVTYLQHHDDKIENTIVYGDDTWSYVLGALQTLDRSYGSIIDNLTHNITNCHIVHHLFYTKIPHYHLEKATKHLYKYFKDNNIPYKYRYSPDFFYLIFKHTYNHLNEAVLIK